MQGELTDFGHNNNLNEPQTFIKKMSLHNIWP